MKRSPASRQPPPHNSATPATTRCRRIHTAGRFTMRNANPPKAAVRPSAQTTPLANDGLKSSYANKPVTERMSVYVTAKPTTLTASTHHQPAGTCVRSMARVRTMDSPFPASAEYLARASDASDEPEWSNPRGTVPVASGRA